VVPAKPETNEEREAQAAEFHAKAIGVSVFCALTGTGMSTSMHHEVMESLERRNALMEGMDEETAARVRALGEDQVRLGWGLSEQEWALLQGPACPEQEELVARIQLAVNSPARREE
jgi:hypothetical protein